MTLNTRELVAAKQNIESVLQRFAPKVAKGDLWLKDIVETDLKPALERIEYVLDTAG